MKEINLKLSRDEKVLIACSGGVDSMTLAHLMLRENNAGNAGNLHAVIINHELRKDSFAEAQQVKSYLVDMGYINIAIINWQHDEIKTAVEEKARKARFNLLFEYALSNGIRKIFLGHHRNDLIENFFLKLGKGAGLFGLVGLKPENKFVWNNEAFLLCRPLLMKSKEEIQKFSLEENIKFINDESNFSDTFQRNRIRKNLHSSLSMLEVKEGGIIQTMQSLDKALKVIKKRVNFILTNKITLNEKMGFFQGSVSDVTSFDREEIYFILKEIIFYLSGITETRGKEIEKAAIKILNLKGFTLGGIEVFFNKNSIYFIRERNAIKMENKKIWDGRFQISGLTSKHEIKLASKADLKKLKVRCDLPSKIIGTLPSIWEEEILLAIPQLYSYQNTQIKVIPKNPHYAEITY